MGKYKVRNLEHSILNKSCHYSRFKLKTVFQTSDIPAKNCPEIGCIEKGLYSAQITLKGFCQ